MQGEPPTRASTPTGAVFLSYASQDAETAKRICNALRAAGIEIWFDQSELRGGDAWDQKIRRQISDCALFLPIVSANTQDRLEGYFRLEWKLAVDRSQMMAAERSFIVPVVIDDTRDPEALVPDRFREVQWTRLPAGEVPPAFVQAIERLLSGETSTTARPATSSRNVSIRGQSATPLSSKRGLSVAVALVVLAAVAYLAIDKPWTSTSTATQASVPPAASIAVLPLANESGETNQQYFSDGISEDLITALSQFQGLKVIGRTSSFQFRDSKEDSRAIGAKLGVAHLLEGSVRRSGEVVRVSAELIDTADGTTQWSDRYDRPYKDLFVLQDEITHAVTEALRAKLLPSQHAAEQSERPPGESLDAYNAMLQGRFYDFRHTEAGDRRAIEHYTQATQIDPRYAQAWSRLSLTWSHLGDEFLEGAPVREAFAKARQAADRALALSPDLAAAHLAQGDVLQKANFDWRGAEAEYRRAIELAPNDAEAKFSLGGVLATFGRLESAIDVTRQALASEPLQANWYGWLAWYLAGLNRLDEAEQATRRAIELQPGATAFHFRLTVIEIQLGNAQEARAAAQQETPGPWQDMALALATQVGGDQRAADAALRTLIDKDAGSAAYQIAQVYALRKEAKATFDWLERAWNNHDGSIGILLYDPFIRRFKDDPRYAAFCRRVGLPAPGGSRQPT